MTKINAEMFKRGTKAFTLVLFTGVLATTIKINSVNVPIEKQPDNINLNAGVTSEIYEVSIENNDLNMVTASYENTDIETETPVFITEEIVNKVNDTYEEEKEKKERKQQDIEKIKEEKRLIDQAHIAEIEQKILEETPAYFRISNEEREYVKNYECNVPNGTDGCKSYAYTYMDYRKVTSRGTINYKTLNCDQAWTDQTTGIRMVGERMCVAVGSGFNVSAGDKIDIELKNGSIFKCIVGDEKANEHTDSSNKFHLVDGSVVEIVVDTDIFKGTYMYPEELDGKVLKVVPIKE